MSERSLLSALAGLAVGALALLLGGCDACGGVAVEVRAGEGEPRFWVCADEAVTASERALGLGGRTDLTPERGLLLTFPVEGEVCIVNETVGFPIDVLFVSEMGHVHEIERSVEAHDGALRCHPSVRRVLEVAAGVADSATPGDALTIHR